MYDSELNPQLSGSKYLDIFVIINNNALMPEVFTMVVDDVTDKPQYPNNIDYPALPIAGVPDIIHNDLAGQPFKAPTMQQMAGATPSIFYLEEGIMLFFRVPLASNSFEHLFNDNYFGPQDLMGGNNNLPPFFF